MDVAMMRGGMTRMQDEATTVKHEIRDVWSELHELTRMQEDTATVHKEIREVWMKIHGLKDKWAELTQDVRSGRLEVAELRISIDTMAENVGNELLESNERCTDLKQENEQMKLVMLNLKQENDALNAAATKMHAYMLGLGVASAGSGAVENALTSSLLMSRTV
jgi:uncharacterized coiled-coil DUF342 family protein